MISSMLALRICRTLCALCGLVAVAPCQDAVEAAGPEWHVELSEITVREQLAYGTARYVVPSTTRYTVKVGRPPGVQVVRMHILVLTRLDSDAGPLAREMSEAHRPLQRPYLVSHQADRRSGLKASTMLGSVPPREARVLVHLEGYFEVDIAVDNAASQEIRLEPAAEWRGRVHAVPGVADLTIELVELDPLKLRVPAGWRGVLGALSLRDGSGAELAVPRPREFNTADAAISEFPISLPPDGAVIIAAPPPTRRQRLAFSFQNVTLPGPQAAGRDAAAGRMRHRVLVVPVDVHDEASEDAVDPAPDQGVPGG